MAQEEEKKDYTFLIVGLLIAAGIAYLLYSMMQSGTSLDMGNGGH